MIDLKILKKTTNVNKLRYAIKQINVLFAEDEEFKTQFLFFIEKLINSFIKNQTIFTANDFNQFCINTKNVIDTFIEGRANNLYKGKPKYAQYKDIENSILNSNEYIFSK